MPNRHNHRAFWVQQPRKNDTERKGSFACGARNMPTFPVQKSFHLYAFINFRLQGEVETYFLLQSTKKSVWEIVDRERGTTRIETPLDCSYWRLVLNVASTPSGSSICPARCWNWKLLVLAGVCHWKCCPHPCDRFFSRSLHWRPTIIFSSPVLLQRPHF